MVPIQPVVRAATSEEEQLRLARFKKYDPPTFSGLASESAQGFLEECHRILCTIGIVEMSGLLLLYSNLRERLISGSGRMSWVVRPSHLHLLGFSFQRCS